jgi:hypothetical protein
VQNANAQCATCPSSVVNINNQTWSLGNVGNLCIIVSGTLTINSNKTFTNCVFKMNPGSRILVTGPFTTLKSNGCCFKGVIPSTLSPGTGWDYIEIAQGSKARFTNSWIQDSWKGILCHPRFTPTGIISLITCKNTTFYNNQIGISTPALVSGNIVGDLNLVLNNCEMYGAIQPSGVSFASVGIFLNNVKNVNLNSATGTNRFHHLNTFGIQGGTIQNLIVSKCSFKNILYNAYGSWAIYVDDGLAGANFVGSVSITGLGGPAIANNTIDNCSHGIAISKANTKVVNCNINVAQDGVSIYNSPNATLNISDNRIKCSGLNSWGRGVCLFNCAPFGLNSKVNNNHIDIFNTVGSIANSLNGVGIWLSGAPTQTKLDIRSNYLNIVSGQYGLMSLGLDQLWVLGNYCNIPHVAGANEKNGFFIQDGSSHTVSCNTVVSNTSIGTNFSATIASPIGIKMDNTKRSFVSCNILGDASGIPTGLHFDHPCDDTKVRGNNFKTTRIGLICGINNCSFVSDNDGEGNEWNMTTPPTGSTTSFFAKHFGGGTQVQASKFKVASIDPTSFKPGQTNGGVDPPSGWFTYLSPTVAFPAVTNACIAECATYSPAPAIATPGASDFNTASFGVALGLDPTPQYPDTEQWQSSLDVYEKLDHDAILRYSTPEYLAFYTSMANTDIARFSEATRLMKNVYPEYDASLAALYDMNDGYMNQLSILDSIFIDTSDSLDDSSTVMIYEAHRNELQNQITANYDDIQQHIAAAYAAKASTVASTLQIVNNLSESAIHEWNEKTIDKIILKTTAIGNANFTSQQQADIITVSNQCPLAGGKIVYTARGLRGLFDFMVYDYDDANNCQAQGFLSRPNDDKMNLAHEQLSLYPNPANTELNIQSNIVHSNIQLQIIDMLGHLVYSNEISTTSQGVKLDISNIPVGIYLINLKTSNGTNKQTKLSIIR